MKMDNGLAKGKVSICVVNYKTEELTRVCLKSIRANTDYPDYEVIVVDNDSGDTSLEYLRSLKWIRLIERHGDVPEGGSPAQGTALDIGLKNASGEFFVAMHSDTFIRRADWLDFLIGKLSENSSACAGSGKLDIKPEWQKTLKRFTDLRGLLRFIAGGKRDSFYIRAICAIYRTGVLLEENLGFAKNTDKITCAKQLYLDLLGKNYKCNAISSAEMSRYVYHLEHATMASNPELKVRTRTRRKYAKVLEKVMASTEIQRIKSMPD
jgi:glycosyltransferase involved in cell wall biosynthesis